jgi:LPS sulfotransferase NodH
MPVQFFIWYEITGDPRSARAAVDALMADVARATGIRGRLHIRRDRPTTWMEIYADVADTADFEGEIAAAVKRNNVMQHTGGARHAETFVAAD